MIRKSELSQLGIARIRPLTHHDMLKKPFASSPDMIGAPFVAVLKDQTSIYIKCQELAEIKTRVSEYMEYLNGGL